MSSDLIQAAGQLVANPLTTAAGAYALGIYSDSIKDITRLAGGNQIKAWADAQWERVWNKAQETNKKLSVESQPPSPAIGLPILQNSMLETRDELLDLWVALLAAAMDPRRASSVRYSFIELVKAMDPDDALLLNSINSKRPFPIPHLGGLIGRTMECGIVSVNNLSRLGIVKMQGEFSTLTALGIELRRALGLNTIE